MELRKRIRKVLSSIQNEILGKEEEIELLMVAFLAGGHILIEDLPGLGKTSVAKSMARSLGLTFRRIQGSSDLMPADILGVHIFNPSTREFELHEGPAFAQLVLFDEMNRTPPRTQSALLQVMAEHQITIDQKTYILKEPYFVIGTQNPLSSDGTYHLPDSQLDRFSLRISLGYPPREHEMRLLSGEDIPSTATDLSSEELVEARQLVRQVGADPRLMNYILDIAHETRNDGRLDHGISVRGTRELLALSQSRAWLKERDYITPDDIQILAPYALGHRILAPGIGSRSLQEEYIMNLLDAMPLPL